MGNPFGIPRRISDAHRPAAGNAEQGEAVESGGVDNRREIADLGLERQVADLPVGQAATTQVVAKQRMAVGEIGQPVPKRPASYCKWVSQVATRTIGGPVPCVA